MSLNATPVTSAKKVAKSNVLNAAAVQAPRMDYSAMKTLKALAPQAKQAKDTIMIYSISQKAYYATEFYFIAKLGTSAIYDFSLFNEEGYYIAAGGWRGSVVDTIAVYNGYGLFSFRSDYILNYGENYEDLEEYVQEYIAEGDMESAAQIAEVAASWKQQWMNNVTAVDQDEETGEYYYGLKPGTYFIGIEGYNSSYRTVTEEADYAMFGVEWLAASNFKAEVSLDNTTATLTWDMPEIYTDTTFQMQLVVYSSEGNVIYSNYDQQADTLKPVSSPLTIRVEEGATYTVSSQIITMDNYEAGVWTEFIFSVGENDYAPKNLTATVIEAEGDSVFFSWETNAQPDAFGIEIYYKSGEYLAKNGYKEGDAVISGTVQAYGIGAHLPPGTYTWAIVSYLYDGSYLNYASEYVQGAEFNTTDLIAPVISGYEVKTAEGSTSATITFEVYDNYYEVDDMKFYVSGDLSGEWTTLYGAYTIDNLEVGKEYTIDVAVEDPAGNINDFATTTITFTAGVAPQEAVDQVIFDIKANKVLRDGQLIIKRDKKAFNALGAEL